MRMKGKRGNRRRGSDCGCGGDDYHRGYGISLGRECKVERCREREKIESKGTIFYESKNMIGYRREVRCVREGEIGEGCGMPTALIRKK